METMDVVSFVTLFVNVLQISTSLRTNVNVIGTTVGPGFYRPEEKLAPKCPATHPYVFNNGQHCCISAMKLDNLTQHATCDGSTIKYDDTEFGCCWKEMFVECHDKQRRCITPLGTCIPKPTIKSSEGTFGLFPAPNILIYEECELDFLMLAGNGRTNFLIVVDLGCEAAITTFKIRNSRNRDRNDRGTKGFTIETSYDEINWDLILSDTLPSVFGVDVCQMPIHEYQIQAHARYLRYTLVDYYGTKGAALNYISWEFVTL